MVDLFIVFQIFVCLPEGHQKWGGKNGIVFSNSSHHPTHPTRHAMAMTKHEKRVRKKAPESSMESLKHIKTY